MRLVENYWTGSKCYKTCKKTKIVPKYIVYHWTATDQKSVSVFRNSWNTSADISKGVNCFIGNDEKGEVYTEVCLPFGIKNWGCGGKMNNMALQFECCYDRKDKEYSLKVYKESIELCAYLCKKYNILPTDILGHYEVYAKFGAVYSSNHADPKEALAVIGKTMDDVRVDSQKALDDLNRKYLVRRVVNDAKTQIGSYSTLEEAKANCKPGYSVIDSISSEVLFKVESITSRSVEDVTNELISAINKTRKLSFKTGGKLTTALQLTIKASVVKLGSKNELVTWVQSVLKELKYVGVDNKTISVDGVFGANTEFAVKALQKKLGVTDDGKVGLNTISAILKLYN